MSDLQQAMIVLAAFSLGFGLIGSIGGELIIYALTRFGWIKPRVVTVHHVHTIEKEAGE